MRLDYSKSEIRSQKTQLRLFLKIQFPKVNTESSAVMDVVSIWADGRAVCQRRKRGVIQAEKSIARITLPANKKIWSRPIFERAIELGLGP